MIRFFFSILAPVAICSAVFTPTVYANVPSGDAAQVAQARKNCQLSPQSCDNYARGIQQLLQATSQKSSQEARGGDSGNDGSASEGGGGGSCNGGGCSGGSGAGGQGCSGGSCSGGKLPELFPTIPAFP